MRTLKVKLLGMFSVLFISISLFGQQQFFESTIKPDTTGETYGMYIRSGSNQECFIGYEYHADHDHGQNNHYRIAMRADNRPGANGVFIGENGQTSLGTNDPCARIVDSSIMLSVEGGAIKVDNAVWSTPNDINLKKNITPLKNSMKKFMNVNFYSFEHKDVEGIQYGVIAQEVKKDFPHSVGSFKKHDQKYLSFNSNNLIFTGLKVVQENAEEITKQKEKIRILKAENERFKAELEAERSRNNQQQNRLDAIEAALVNQGIDLSQTDTSEPKTKRVNRFIHKQIQGNHPRLEQNVPNPFSRFTTISYYLSDDTQTAALVIHDMNGNTIAQHVLPTQKGAGKIDIDIEDIQLRGGVFAYSLHINGDPVDTKKMILSAR